MVVSADALGLVYEHRPWLQANDKARYYHYQADRVLAYMMGNDLAKAKLTLSKLHLPNDVDQSERLKVVVPKLWSLFYIYNHDCTNLDTAKDAMDAYLTDAPLLSHLGQPKYLGWLHFFVAKASFHLGRFREAQRALEIVLSQRKSVGEIVVIHVRTMLLIAYAALQGDQEFLLSAAVACLKFLHRSQNVPSYVLVAARCIARIAKTPWGSLEHKAEFLCAIQETKVAFDQSAHGIEFSFRYHDGLKNAFDLILTRAVTGYQPE